MSNKVPLAEGPIGNEDEFNKFYTYNPKGDDSTTDQLRSLMSVDHEIVMTYGDWHLENILVLCDPVPQEVDDSEEMRETKKLVGPLSSLSALSGHSVAIAAIFGWRACGAYPSYWEVAKMEQMIPPVHELHEWTYSWSRLLGSWREEIDVHLRIDEFHRQLDGETEDLEERKEYRLRESVE